MAQLQIESFRWWFLPSWIGLDAPMVVTTWTWAASRAAQRPMPIRPAAAMFLVVWGIYLSDRLWDVARCRDWSCATARLRFGRHHRRVFLVCLAGAGTGIVWLLSLGLPPEVLRRALVVAVGVTLHFLLFVAPVAGRRRLFGKEFGVGVFFALGGFACIGGAAADIPLFTTTALLVAYNCLIIAAKDAESDRMNDPGAASAWWSTISRDLFWSGIVLIATISAAIFASHHRFYGAAIGAASFLTVLHSFGKRVSGSAFRALADYALLTPLAAAVVA